MITAEEESTHPEEEDHRAVEDLEEPGGAPVNGVDAHLLSFGLVKVTEYFEVAGGFGHHEMLKCVTASVLALFTFYHRAS